MPVGLWSLRCYTLASNGLATDCWTSVLIRDLQPPSLSCPNITLATDPGQSYATWAWPRNATATDNVAMFNSSCSGGPANNRFNFSSFNSTRISCIAFDTSGNNNTCVYYIRVQDREAPRLICPTNKSATGNTTLGLPTGQLQAAYVNVTDNIAAGAAVCVPPLGSLFAIGATNVTCSATDTSMNVGTCTFVTTISDFEPPRLVCSNQTVSASRLGPNITTLVAVGSSDNSNRPVSVACSPGGLPNASLFVLGTTVVRCVGLDGSLNSAACTFNVSVSCSQSLLDTRYYIQVPASNSSPGLLALVRLLNHSFSDRRRLLTPHRHW